MAFVVPLSELIILLCLQHTIFKPLKNDGELEWLALADGGVGGTLSRTPNVAKAQAKTAGPAYTPSCRKQEEEEEEKWFNSSAKDM